VQIPAAQGIQQLRMPSCGPRGMDPLVGNAFREMEHPTAIREHRGAALFEIEPASFDFAQMNKKICLDCIAALDERKKAFEQFRAGDSSENVGHDMTS
jgi:hypothetical protein